MPTLWAALLGGLINIAGTIAGKVLIALGISVITYTGLSTTTTWLLQQAVTSFQGLPAQVLGMLALMKVGSCMSMVASAIAVRMTLQGLTGDSVKSWVKK